jgi:predicted AlkP superfamily phosphohydrolase/phosphomutase
MSRSAAHSGQRTLLIGLDSADADLIEAWSASGFLPTFARLRREGLWGRLRTSAEVMHVSAWPTLYTGATPGHHGMYHAYQVRAGDQRVHRTEPEWCGLPPFWKYLDDAGRKCIIFDAFMDYRLPAFKGVQVVDYGTWTWFGEPGSTPGGMLREIQRRFGRYPAPEHSNLVQVPDDLGRFAGQLAAGASTKGRVVQALVREHDWDLMFVTFGEPHGAGHYLWHAGDPSYPTHPQGTGDRNRVRDVYVAVDSAIGGILEAAGDEVTVAITSGDGMGPNYSGCHLMPEMLHRLDLFHGGGVGGDDAGAAAPKKGLLSTVRQAIPIGWRQSVTRCLPRAMRYRLSMKWVNSGIDWSRSRVFCIPNSNEGYFRVNLRGREPLGIVAPGAEYQDLVDSLHEELGQLRNPANGLRAADRVFRMDDVYPGPRRGDLPDAVINWNLEARILDEIVSPRAGRIRRQPGYAVSPFYNGNHRAAAFILARGPNVQAGATLAGGDILDIAPTMLTRLGVDLPGHFEGRPLPALL